LHRIINFLNRYGDRIKYQYDILDGYVYFRILKEGKSANLDIIEIRSLFTFGIDDYTETLGGNDCSFTGIDNLIQFKIKAYEEKECSPPSFINYARSQFLCAIKRLANKSEALDKDLEIIDEEAFCERMALSLFNYEFI